VVPRAKITSASGHGAEAAVGATKHCIADAAKAPLAIMAMSLNFPTSKS
jgi:hypothetical protein